MAIEINILGKKINFPEQGANQPWGDQVVDFAKAVENALNSINSGSEYDIPRQTFNINAYNPATSDILIPDLSISSLTVRGFEMYYTVSRETNLNKVSETGKILGVYNADNPVNNKWEISRIFNGDAKINFKINDSGQFFFKTELITGTLHIGFITFSVFTLKNE